MNTPHPRIEYGAGSDPEAVKELNFSPAFSGVKTGVQSVRNTPKTLDSGFRRNDVKKKRVDFFTPFLSPRGEEK
jgi:hypothetical protein